ncbi:flavin-containing monooxygenase [Nocardia rhizosphaerihabitans]|uniref:Flavin-binding monooxygenase n=1 Tax=Nocardia rhizosphaerihabitans TaxID=1691570 RepID=A0ABQ2L259_9NOCA|nr:NAD(P)/FAD-dependent oxidoreductase [Nocardia rhizosphaerihabitans]GGO00091.1 flavin-binding monooxygenase [Nocardia rhizosphaerihabitans]
MATSIAPAAATTFEHVDVLVVGAGISGISTAYHLKHQQPGRTFAIVEARNSLGGTWDLFRYPGLRSDSDLQTFGFGFKPWRGDNAIADAHEIVDYLQETLEENDLARHLHLGHKVSKADFSSADQRWLVTLERACDGAQFDVTAGMLFSAAGYYDYDQGYSPQFVGREDFGGQIIHPQHWPDDLDYSGKNVVVIGSGATAVTIVPNIAAAAGHVTMLQRSPSYVLPIPRQDPIANTLRRLLPEKIAYSLTRGINIRKANLLYKGSQRFPKQMRALVRKVNTAALPEGYDVDTHFSPAYNPWDQRMCMVPDGDLFKAISDGRASVATDEIVRFTKSGILLESGEELAADIVVTATGLNMVPFGKIALAVDGAQIELPDHVVYKTLMLSDVPNFAFTVGYVNNSWTLKADLVAQWFCRLLAHMDQNGYSTVTPVVAQASMPLSDYIAMDTGYINRGMPLFPKQGDSGPWLAPQDFNRDRVVLGKDPIEDPELRFSFAELPQTDLHDVAAPVVGAGVAK